MKKAKNTETVETEVNVFTQLCVWPGTTLDGSTPEEFEEYMKKELNARVKFEAVVLTLPDLNEDGTPVAETGGRSDLFFYVHSEDIPMFALQKIPLGIRWWEDVVSYNGEYNSHLYTEEFKAKYPAKW